jgi:hypothetical protein
VLLALWRVQQLQADVHIRGLRLRLLDNRRVVVLLGWLQDALLGVQLSRRVLPLLHPDGYDLLRRPSRRMRVLTVERKLGREAVLLPAASLALALYSMHLQSDLVRLVGLAGVSVGFGITSLSSP